MKRKLTASLLNLLLMAGCATSEHEAKKLDTKLDAKGSTENGRVGIDDDGKVVIQSEIDAAEELRTQQWVNNKLESDIKQQYAELKRCRLDMSDPRLGGDGSIATLPEVDNMKSMIDVKEQFGIAEDDDLKLVKREFFLDRLKKERKYGKSLKNMKRLLVRHHDECSQKMAIARRRNGLPSKRYESEGYFSNDGTWVTTKKAERNLDDAFERAVKSQKP